MAKDKSPHKDEDSEHPAGEPAGDNDATSLSRPETARTVQQPRIDPNETILSADETDIVDGYQMVCKLGEGGMGVVYKAVQRSLNREVALKLMKNLGGDESFLARFRREAITGARLNHPNIVAVYDHGQVGGNVYLVMEFVKGRNCSELLESGGRMALSTVLEIMRCCVLGLSHAEKLGVIHRDIKPANIMVVDDEASDARGRQRLQAKIADFGLARLHDASDPDHVDLTQTGSVMGTPGYMAPEQALGREVDFRADIYSLGSTMYCLLTGSKPFHGATMVEVLHKKLNEKAPNPQDLAGDIPDDVILVLDRMMAKSQDDRYQSYENLLMDLDALIAGETPQTASVDPSASSLDVHDRSRSGRAAASGKGRGRPLLLALIAAAALGAAAFFFSRHDEPREAPEGLQEIVEDNAGADFLTALKGVQAKERWDLWKKRTEDVRALLQKGGSGEGRTTFVQQLRPVLKPAVRFAVNQGQLLQDLMVAWKARRWKELAQVTEDVMEACDIAGVSPPPLVVEYQKRSAMAGEVGQAEKEHKFWQAIEAARKRGDLSRDMLATFLERFPFSPDHETAVAWLEQLEKDDRADRMRQEVAGMLEQFRSVSGDGLFRFLATTSRSWNAAVATLDADAAKKARASWREILKEKLKLYRSRTAERLTTLWHERDYTAFRALLKEARSHFQELNEPLPPGWTNFDMIAKASAGTLGLEEREAWEALKACSDPSLRIALLEDYIKRYKSFSPTLARAERELKAARAAAPELTLKVIPEEAELLFDGRLLAGERRRGHWPAGDYEVTAKARGYLDLHRRIHHASRKETLVLRMSPRPRRVLRRDPEDPRNVNPMRTYLRPGKTAGLFNRGLSVSIAPGALVVTSNDMKGGGWRMTKPILLFDPSDRIVKSVMPPARQNAWQFCLILELVEGCRGEVRLECEQKSRFVVAGLEKTGERVVLYFGLRESAGLVDMYRAPLPEGRTKVALALTWFGDVVGLSLPESSRGESLQATVPIGGLSRPPRMIFAVDRASMQFAETEIFPIK